MSDYGWEQHIAMLAYYKWEAEGRPEGRSEEFWVEAEREFYDMLNANNGNGPFTNIEQ